MALTIIVPVEKMATAEVDALSHSFRNMGGKNHMVNGEIHFPFDNAGENYFSPDAYAICNGFDLKCEGGMFYAVLTSAKMYEEVPDNYPDNIQVIIPDGENKKMTYAEYFRKDTQYDLGDGTWLFRIVRHGKSLSNVDRLIYQKDLGVLLVKAQGVARFPKTEEI